MDLAAEYENDIVGGVKNPKIPAHISLGEMTERQLEDMALVLYAGDIPSGLAEQDMLDMQYYIPVCTPPGSITSASKGWECSTQWYWAVNDSQVDSNVQAGNIFPSGYVFPPGVTGIFDNQQGVAYVSVVRANLH